MSTSVLVIAAHPDDEILGCGSTLARHIASGDCVDTVIIAEGATSRGEGRKEVDALRDAAQAAARVLGARPPEFLGFPDNRLDCVPLLDIVKKIEKTISDIHPAVVYTHHGGDLNVDHQITHRAVIAACRPLPGAPVRAIYGFETVSATEWSSAAIGEAFRPARFCGIKDYLEAKVKALQCYATEMRPFPHARSIDAVRALALWRGASCGLEAAEAFTVIREISADEHPGTSTSNRQQAGQA